MYTTVQHQQTHYQILTNNQISKNYKQDLTRIPLQPLFSVSSAMLLCLKVKNETETCLENISIHSLPSVCCSYKIYIMGLGVIHSFTSQQKLNIIAQQQRSNGDWSNWSPGVLLIFVPQNQKSDLSFVFPVRQSWDGMVHLI